MSNNLPRPDTDVSDNDFKDYMGANAYKFEKAREKFLAGKSVCGESVSLSSVPFFLAPTVYAAYYRYYTPIIVMIVATTAAKHFVSPAAGNMVAIALWVFFLMTAKTQIVKNAYKKIEALKQQENDESRLKALLATKGKPSLASVIIILAIYGALFFASSVTRGRELMTAHNVANFQLPACDSDEAIEGVTDAIQNGPYKNQINLEVLDVSEIKDETPAKVNQNGAATTVGTELERRHCAAKLTMNTGVFNLAYKFERKNPTSDEYIVTANWVDWNLVH